MRPLPEFAPITITRDRHGFTVAQGGRTAPDLTLGEMIEQLLCLAGIDQTDHPYARYSMLSDQERLNRRAHLRDAEAETEPEQESS